MKKPVLMTGYYSYPYLVLRFLAASDFFFLFTLGFS